VHYNKCIHILFISIIIKKQWSNLILKTTTIPRTLVHRLINFVDTHWIKKRPAKTKAKNLLNYKDADDQAQVYHISVHQWLSNSQKSFQ